MNQNYTIILKGNSTEVVKSIKLKTTTSKTRRRTLSRKDFKSEREYSNHLLKALKPYVEYITKHKI